MTLSAAINEIEIALISIKGAMQNADDPARALEFIAEANEELSRAHVLMEHARTEQWSKLRGSNVVMLEARRG
jgi:hypothetical protein